MFIDLKILASICFGFDNMEFNLSILLCFYSYQSNNCNFEWMGNSTNMCFHEYFFYFFHSHVPWLRKLCLGKKRYRNFLIPVKHLLLSRDEQLGVKRIVTLQVLTLSILQEKSSSIGNLLLH